ncbi:M48 family metallopeptidase [Ketobacter alkanivorans]|uniref:Peptidase M48 n=1 Tax=Ketobacter alkanivorans TaxID=1917421 RepID=A0A2K9LMC3_9GAMM|nr:M48 family metallopeptidase [Ketobacter alkanivorans]AUM13506.1 peptidase M48 [Ketobacter alkanivorans]
MSHANYAGHAFHDSFNNGRASGEITITDAHVQFRNDQGNVRFSITGAQFKLGGASDRLLFISHPSQPGWNLYTSDLSILKHPALHNDPAVQAQVKKARNTKRLAWGVFGSVGMLLVAIPLCIVLFMDSITGPLARHVPAEWEEKLGETAFGQYQMGQEFLPQEEADTLLEPMIQPLLDHLDSDRYQYRFHISRDDQVNAFALPGGYIVINSGLILKADSADEMLGVVAHEIAHVTQQHSVRNIMGTAGVYLTINAVLGDMTGLLAVMADAAPFLINQSYSRGFESEADAEGLALLHRAGINPEGLITFFEKLRQQEQEQIEKMAGEDNSAAVESTLQFLSTHPATEDRIAQLRKRIDALPHQRERDLQTEFTALQERVKLFVAEEDEEEQ